MERTEPFCAISQVNAASEIQLTGTSHLCIVRRPNGSTFGGPGGVGADEVGVTDWAAACSRRSRTANSAHTSGQCMRPESNRLTPLLFSACSCSPSHLWCSLPGSSGSSSWPSSSPARTRRCDLVPVAGTERGEREPSAFVAVALAVAAAAGPTCLRELAVAFESWPGLGRQRGRCEWSLAVAWLVWRSRDVDRRCRAARRAGMKVQKRVGRGRRKQERSSV